jgi:hypothetical protein
MKTPTRPKRPVASPRGAPADNLRKQLDQRTLELAEALEQQTAASEVLRVISSSPGELEPVFKAMLENAVRICDASFGMLFRFEDSAWRAAAMLGVPPAFADFWRRGGFAARTLNAFSGWRPFKTSLARRFQLERGFDYPSSENRVESRDRAPPRASSAAHSPPRAAAGA